MQTHLTLRRTAGRITLTDSHETHDLGPYFTVTRDRQGLNAHRAGEYQRSFVDPIKEWLFGPKH